MTNNMKDPAMNTSWASYLTCVCVLAFCTQTDRVFSSEAEENEVETEILKFTKIEKSYTGTTSQRGNKEFSFLDNYRSIEVQNYNPEAITNVIIKGPAALTVLLKHLDDQTLTKLEISLNLLDFGTIIYHPRVPFNVENALEFKAIEDARLPTSPEIDDAKFADSVKKAHMLKYRVTVGDICFVVIGEIANRNFETISYQPSSSLTISSPTYDKRIVNALRDIWKDDNHSESLFKMLVIDLNSKLIGSESLRCGAAIRLLKFFPQRSLPLIIACLNKPIYKSKSFVNAVDWYQNKELSQVLEGLKIENEQKLLKNVKDGTKNF